LSSARTGTGITTSYLLGRVRVVVRSALPEVLHGLHAAWWPCADRNETAALGTIDFAVDRDGIVRRDGTALGHLNEGGQPLPRVERAAYRELMRCETGELLIHAALLALGKRPVLLLGRSGAGKSSCARAALRRGWRYGSDELVRYHATGLNGVPRSVQFDPIDEAEPTPPYVADCDVDSYRFRARDGRAMRTPLYHPAAERIIPRAIPADAVTLVFLEPGSDECRPLPHGAALLRLYQEVRGEPDPDAPDLARLIQRSWLLGSRKPDRAIVALEAILKNASLAGQPRSAF